MSMACSSGAAPDDFSASKPKILIINTKFSNDLRLADADDANHHGLPDFSIINAPSSKIEPAMDAEGGCWDVLSRLIYSNYYNYTGFVIVSKTESIVHTATAMSFMLQNLGKPVIFTGCLIAPSLVHSDFKRNLILSMYLASSGNVSEVTILFAEQMLRANRTTKVSSVGMQPFDSPHIPPLASMIGKSIKLERHRLRPAPKGRLVLWRDMAAKVEVIILVPSIDRDVLLSLVANTAARGIVLCGFGSGNFPIECGAVHAAATLARQKGKIVVICTQVRFGAVNISSYEAGRQLIETGVIEARDMTVECTVVKLKYLLGKGLPLATTRKLITADLRGEITDETVASL